MTVIRDITDLIRAEQIRTTEHLSEVMMATISHDMRTPLNTIVSMHNLIVNKVSDPLALKWLRVSKNSTLLLCSLVNDTLDYFQIKNDKFSLKPVQFSINKLLDDCEDLISIQMELKNL